MPTAFCAFWADEEEGVGKSKSMYARDGCSNSTAGIRVGNLPEDSTEGM